MTDGRPPAIQRGITAHWALKQTEMEKVLYTVKPGLTRVTFSALVEKGRNCVTMMTGNPAYTTPTPKLADVTDVCDAVDEASQRYSFTRSLLDKQLRDAGFLQLKGLMKDLAGYVQAISAGDKELILSAGFEVEKSRTPVGELPAVVDVRAEVNAHPGRIDVRWKGLRGRSIYELEIREDGPTGPGEWTQLAMTTKNRYVVEGLTSNSVYSFRVIAIGTAGAAPASDAATAKAA